MSSAIVLSRELVLSKGWIFWLLSKEVAGHVGACSRQGKDGEDKEMKGKSGE